MRVALFMFINVQKQYTVKGCIDCRSERWSWSNLRHNQAAHHVQHIAALSAAPKRCGLGVIG